ncbi:glucose 1-dehydrogenase [Mesorhizobium sp. BR1-1-9]|uniref:glucose 1-dehydrogenase n=1 Tax=unclassified Mesorhizobium TaxID=325217 RepID=UPI001CD08E6F|nr:MULTISPECIES: glucose 1-dehydrogenase [unclassified Mesorhizobium]MBZ9871456.1 glucose 1-dehydrogenase [Mesorhizobium sp. BR1-1-9]MBZ9943340.1 glucose 1-dehydrogenase [Mesorhizobium sp. BR1-1-13]
MSSLNGKVAIVTGASKGIGAAIAKGLAAAGAAVVVNFASSREAAERVVAAITDAGGRAVAVKGDVAVAADVRGLFETAKSSFGGLDILVNNAGVFRFEPLEAVTEAEFHRQFDTNVLGIVLAIQEAAKQFGPQGGSIINISSIASFNPQPSSLVYAATKAAVDSITLSMSRELGARRIRVNSIAPGGVYTEGLRRTGVVGGEAEARIVGLTPLGRFGQPEDIARVAVFLASDEASWLTGERIAASGGWR